MKIVSFLLFSAVIFQVQAQNSPLDGYIKEALKNNLALKQQQLSYKSSLQALEEAKALFLPTFSVEARYSMARGGRIIDIPTGDLVNPVYDNLNLLNRISEANIPNYPNIPVYPSIENQQTRFLRENRTRNKSTNAGSCI